MSVEAAAMRYFEARREVLDREPVAARWNMEFLPLEDARAFQLRLLHEGIQRAERLTMLHAHLLAGALDADGNWLTCSVEIPKQVCGRCGWQWAFRLIKSAFREHDLCEHCHEAVLCEERSWP